MSLKLLLPIAEQLIVKRLISNKPPVTHISKIGLGLTALSGFLLCLATVFMAIAFHAWLLTMYDAPVAGLITTAFLLGFAIIAFISALLIFDKKRAAPAAVSTDFLPKTEDIKDVLSQFTDLFADEIEHTVRENPKTALALALAFGFVASHFMRS